MERKVILGVRGVGRRVPRRIKGYRKGELRPTETNKMSFHVAKGNTESNSGAWGLMVICMPPSKRRLRERERQQQESEISSKAAVLGMPAQFHSTSSDDFIILIVIWLFY